MNFLEKGRMLWHSLEETSINSNISSSDKFNHYSLLFCYLLSLFVSPDKRITNVRVFPLSHCNGHTRYHLWCSSDVVIITFGS